MELFKRHLDIALQFGGNRAPILGNCAGACRFLGSTDVRWLDLQATPACSEKPDCRLTSSFCKGHARNSKNVH